MPIHMRAISRETLDFRVIWTHTRNNPGLGIMQSIFSPALRRTNVSPEGKTCGAATVG
jgi:hypothetical protein